MDSLSFKKFCKLSEEEKYKQYKNLNDYDKFLARMVQDPGGEVVGHEKVTEEEREWSEKLNKQILEENSKNT